VALFLLELAPLELQRRIVNGAVESSSFRLVALLCALYVGVILTQGGLKLVLNVYRGSVAETAVKRLRLEPNLERVARADGKKQAGEEGVAISIIVSEVEAVGGFVGTSVSEPVLNGGILLSVFGYMLVVEPWMALVALALFIPQVFFIPLLQESINRRTEKRIKTVRAMTVDIVDKENGEAGAKQKTYRRRVGEVYRLNMQIFRRKYAMTFLMNFVHHLGIVGILFVGGWLLMRGETEVGTVVAFISGLNRTHDPWGDLVTWFRDLTNNGVKYQLIARAIGDEPGSTR
jgi:ABC-type multidrug transport system fused ATPase/permease subunit